MSLVYVVRDLKGQSVFVTLNKQDADIQAGIDGRTVMRESLLTSAHVDVLIAVKRLVAFAESQGALPAGERDASQCRLLGTALFMTHRALSPSETSHASE